VFKIFEKKPLTNMFFNLPQIIFLNKLTVGTQTSADAYQSFATFHDYTKLHLFISN